MAGIKEQRSHLSETGFISKSTIFDLRPSASQVLIYCLNILFLVPMDCACVIMCDTILATSNWSSYLDFSHFLPLSPFCPPFPQFFYFSSKFFVPLTHLHPEHFLLNVPQGNNGPDFILKLIFNHT